MIQQHTRVAAYGLVIHEQKILLCRLSSQVQRLQGHWTLPGGGLDFGEHPEQAMVREVMEETGVIVRARSVATVDSVHDNSRTPDYHGIRVVYHTDYVGGELSYEQDGTTDYCQWCTLDDVRGLSLVPLAQLGIEIMTGDLTG